MSLPRQGRQTGSSASAKLGARDPRGRRNAQMGLSDNDLDEATLSSESGKVRVSALDGIGALPENAPLADVIRRLNLVTRKIQGA